MDGAAAQQMFPTRTVRFILPFGAGSASDTTARLFAERLSYALGQAGSGGEPSWR
jgi:tripartite-type tricarboxylate transporter receptor subunit TctC